MTFRLDPQIDPPFELLSPRRLRAPILFSSPHSGRSYPASFLKASRLDPFSLRRSEDCFVDELFEGVVALGVPLLRAVFPRAYLDLNREPYELDPRMFAGRLPHYANTRSIRVAGGLGTIARIVSDSHEIYHGPLNVEEALGRIDNLYKPYHRTLAATLSDYRRAYGIAVLIDCHSMPSSASFDEDEARPDIVLGDRYGTSCSAAVTDAAQASLEAMGYAVRRNKPYAGGYITERYGHPLKGLHALQIEVNRNLYMDETALARSPGFATLRDDMARLSNDLVGLVHAAASPPREAAE